MTGPRSLNLPSAVASGNRFSKSTRNSSGSMSNLNNQTNHAEVWVALRRRHAFPYFDPVHMKDLTDQEYRQMTATDKRTLTRRTLTSEQIESLLKLAVDLHAREIASQQEIRWLTIPLFGFLTA